ncbi:DUF2326 domain-containing protein [Faecalicatena contorta]|uniref:Uncharacterized protein YydD, contains DUF2326 domain n=1 Tax=Faecalicatena contorta TaxID=39482 RepID=A0A315ZT92_9FIRM|nr:DUF2326 domain-containing protein [Faecalicatena contorta]PWJ48098.1 uncharacterized protein YydD (DUF2326 family) [Faecalicatena contorta]SUQ15625.1 Uncharacterized protein YydD, contains DUF2326 domain [Faecalicatena contorta]
MLIERLIIRKTKPQEDVVRDIRFNLKGLSLIVDNTSDDANDSGNSVGKTTAIKIIDLCLGAKSVRELYYDSDTRSENQEVKEFLSSNKVQAELLLLDEKTEIRYSIKRDLFLRGKKYINEISMTEQEFWDKLKEVLFNIAEPYPTFRQLLTKFIRLSGSSEESMIKYLPNTSHETYDSIYCVLFQLYRKELISQKSEISSKISDCQKAIATLEKSKSIGSLSVLKQSLELIDTDLTEYRNKRKKLSYIDEYREELDTKRQITLRINDLQEKMQIIEFEMSTIEDSINQLNEEKSNIDTSILKDIYLEAQSYIPELQKKFEDLLNFHNTMIQNKIDFIKEQYGTKELILNTFKDQLDGLISEKEKVTLEVLDEGLLDELNIINKKIEELSQQKGEVSQSIALLEEQEANKDSLFKELKDVEAKMDGSDLEEKIKKFNQIFSDYCEKLYGEKYLLAYNQNWAEEKKFPISIASIGGKIGTGKKKAVIVAFDLAYMQYAILMNIKAPHFVIHDKMENTHINQLKTIFEIAQGIDGQYIIPILRERIDKVDQVYIDKAKVLELREDDKFFKL